MTAQCDLSLLQVCGEVLGTTTIHQVVDRFYQWLPKQPEFVVIFFNSKDEVDPVKKLQKIYWADFFSGVVACREPISAIPVERKLRRPLH